MENTIAVLYTRTSTEDQSLGHDAQRAACERWASAHGVRIVVCHEDRLSGATPPEDRPGFVAALQSLKSEGAGLLLAAKRDRLARDVVVAATIERLVMDASATVATADGVPLENTPEGGLMRGLLDLFAAYERALIRSRTKAALAAKRARGLRVGGRPPVGFGYVDGRLVPAVEEQSALRRIRAMRQRGLSLRRVADILNSEGARIRGGRWHVTTIARTLRSRA